MGRTVRLPAALLCGLALSTGAPAQRAARGAVEISIAAPTAACKDRVVTVRLPVSVARNFGRSAVVVAPEAGLGQRLPAQISWAGGETSLTFVLPQISPGQRLLYSLRKAGAAANASGVRVSKESGDLRIDVGGRLFSRYTSRAAPNKPVFYPLLTPDGRSMTRRWPVEPDALRGESRDHPHHRGLWFTHSSVNGVDFWTEVGVKGRTVTTGFTDIESGPVFAGFRAATEWRMPDNRLIATDVRTVRVYALPSGDRLLDFRIVITPVGGPLTFGDNKDGVFGLRVPDSMAITADRSSKIAGQGHIETSTGLEGKAAWGTRAEWVDYWGPVDGETWGVAIFDAPGNLRHPTTWHARDYALFTANPFGLHDFGLGPKGAGDTTVTLGTTLAFHYGVLFHAGTTHEAAVSEEYRGFAEAPRATLNP